MAGWMVGRGAGERGRDGRGGSRGERSESRIRPGDGAGWKGGAGRWLAVPGRGIFAPGDGETVGGMREDGKRVGMAVPGCMGLPG